MKPTVGFHCWNGWPQSPVCPGLPSGGWVVTRHEPDRVQVSLALGLQALCCCPVCSHAGQVLLSQTWDPSSLSPALGSCSVLGPAGVSQGHTCQRCDHVPLILSSDAMCLRQKEKCVCVWGGGVCMYMNWGQSRALCSWHFPLQHFMFSHHGSARSGAWLCSFTPFPQSGFGHMPAWGWTCPVLQTVKSQLALGSFAPRTACDSAPWPLVSF